MRSESLQVTNRLFILIRSCALKLLMATVVLNAGGTSAEEPGDFLRTLVGRSDCDVSQFEGLVPGGKHQEHFMILLSCRGGAHSLMLIRGPYPISSKPDLSLYRVEDRREITSSEGGSVDLAAGVCRKGKSNLTTTVAVSGTWGSRTQIARGSGLIEVLGVSGDLNRLEEVGIMDLVCYREEP
jgi:hypothetical protein